MGILSSFAVKKSAEKIARAFVRKEATKPGLEAWWRGLASSIEIFSADFRQSCVRCRFFCFFSSKEKKVQKNSELSYYRKIFPEDEYL